MKYGQKPFAVDEVLHKRVKDLSIANKVTIDKQIRMMYQACKDMTPSEVTKSLDGFEMGKPTKHIIVLGDTHELVRELTKFNGISTPQQIYVMLQFTATDKKD